MRALKIIALITLFSISLLGATLAWLVRSEEGSRWLLEQGIAFSPVTIEVSGIAGTLDQGLAVESLYIKLPLADIRARDIAVSWSPGHLLAGTVWLDSVRVAALSIDVQPAESTADPDEDLLQWLQLTTLIYIDSAELDQLRIDAAEITDLRFSGAIGHGGLEVASLSGQVAGASLQVSGELTGPAPGHLEAQVSWVLPAANVSGSGSFSGDIEELLFEQQIDVPERVSFSGSIYDLFTGPTLAGTADWLSVQLPGTTPIHIYAGMVAVSSDFHTARLEGASVVALDGWPEAQLQLAAVADLQAISIDNYVMQALGGQVAGSGRIDYSNGLRGQLTINASQIDGALINDDISGRLGFNSSLLIESADAFALEVAAAQALIAGNEWSGNGSLRWRGGELATAKVNISAGRNVLVANVMQGQQLAGEINADFPELALLWPGLQGALFAELTLGGSLTAPRFTFAGNATSLAYGAQSADTLRVSGELQANNKLAGTLTATGMVVGRQELGGLDMSLKGTLDNHQARLTLAGDIVEVELRSVGAWDGDQLIQRLEYGRVQPEGFDSWLLEQPFGLRVSASGGELDAHCWQQAEAGLCVDASSWSATSLQSNINISSFALASLQPLLAEGYSVDGTVDANLQISGDRDELHGELRWRQAHTLLGYTDGIDLFQTQLDEVRIDLSSDASRTIVVASISGAEGLTLVASADVDGPLTERSPVTAAAKGSMPSIGLLRPLLERVVNPGELQGELTIDLDVGGTLGDPVFTGGAYLREAALGLPDAGITLSDINIAATANSADKLVISGQLRSGGGSAEIRGDISSEVNKQGASRLVAGISIKGEKLASLRTPDLSVDTSPDLMLRIGAGAFDVSGVIVIPRARAEIRDLPRNAVPRSADVIVHAPERTVNSQDETIVTGDIEVLLGDDVRFKGFGLDSQLNGALRLRQSRGDNLVAAGMVRVQDGFLTGYGKELRVDRGELTFTGPLDDPVINIQVSRVSNYQGRQYTVGLRLTGTAQNVRTEPYSRPAMSDNDVLSFLLIDQPTGSGADASGAAVAMGLGQLMPGDGGLLGLDEVSFETNDANKAAMVAGKRINDALYVRYVFGSLGEPGSFRIRYRLGKGFSLEASTGSTSQQSLDLIYLLER